MFKLESKRKWASICRASLSNEAFQIYIVTSVALFSVKHSRAEIFGAGLLHSVSTSCSPPAFSVTHSQFTEVINTGF